MDDQTRQEILAQPVIDYIPKENSQAFLYLKRILHWQRTNSKIGILVVDDSSSARNHVVELLKRRNFVVFVAENGEKALELVENNNNIKMVVTDLEMPVLDGIGLTIELRKNMPVIAYQLLVFLARVMVFIQHVSSKMALMIFYVSHSAPKNFIVVSPKYRKFK